MGQNCEKFLSSPFDSIIAGMQRLPVVDPLDIDTPEAAAKALFETITTGSYTPPTRYTTPIYETPDSKTAPAGSPWKEQSSPFPSEFKADINKRKGIIESYLTVFDDPETGKPFVDPYLDVIERGSFNKTIANLEALRKRGNDPHLVPYLWQHERKEVLGGVTYLKENSTGIVYVAQLVQSVKRAQECLDLMEQRVLGSSFGYDAVLFEHKGDNRHLKEIRLHECSAVTFPANHHAKVLAVKSQFFVPAKLPNKQLTPVNRLAIKTNLNTASSLFEQLTNLCIKAHQQYKYESEMNKPRFRR